jgi:tetratricopeptide (TPR) repeat protein
MALVFAGSAKSAGAEIKTFIQEYRYRAGQGDDKNAIRIIAMRNVKRLLLEALGTYLEKETATRSDRINKDQLTVLAAGIVETDIIDEKWEGHTYWLKSKMTLDSDEVIRSMDTLRRDREKTREVEELGKQADGLLQESEKRIRELAVAKGKRRETDKMAFEKTIKKLAAIDWSEKGHVQFNRGKYDQAIQDFNQAIELDPPNVGAYYNRGLAHTNLRKHDQAIRDYNRVIELDPAFVTAYVNRGLTSFNLGQHDQAIQDISKAIELNPRLAAAYNVRGIVNANLGKFDQAIRDYDKALGLSPRFVAAYINRGLANFNHARYDQAIQDFNRAIELDPKLTVSHIYRGLAHYTLGKYDQAVQDYNRAIELNPNQAVPYYNRARVYSRQERHEQALQDLKKAVQINPDFKNTAKTDHDFDRMRKEPEFINLIGE